MKTKIVYICLISFIIPYFLYAKKIAIFDFDDRLKKTDTVAKYIEKLLKKRIKSLVIHQFSGKENEKHSIKVLENLDKTGYDLIITITTDALIIANHIIKKTPTIFTNVNNPLFLGFKTLGPTGRNITGATYYVPIKKQILFFKKIQPKMRKIGFIFDTENKSRLVEVAECREVCNLLKLDYAFTFISKKGELLKKVKLLLKEKIDAVIVTSSNKIYDNMKLFLIICNKNRIPIYSFHKKGVKNGAIASLSSDYKIMAKTIIIPMAIKILFKNINPGKIPIAFLKKNFILINLTQAKKIGLRILHKIINKASKIY